MLHCGDDWEDSPSPAVLPFLLIIFIIALATIFFGAVCSHAATSDLISGDLRAVSVDIQYAEAPGLAEVLRVSSSNNPGIAAAIERVNQFKAGVKEAVSAFGPTITAGVGGQWNKDSQSGIALDPATGAVIGVIPLGFRNVYNASLTFVQTLYSGGTIAANRSAAELALSAVSAEALRVYQSVLYSARSAYYDCLRSMAQLEVAMESLRLSQAHLKRTESLHNAGLVPVREILRAKVAVSQGELDRITAENSLEVNWVALERVAGAPVERDRVLKSPSEDKLGELSPPAYSPPDDAVTRALGQRAEIKASRFYKLQADQMANAAAGQRLPRVNLSGRTSAADDTFWPGDDTWSVQLDFQWTLFDSGKISSQVERAKASARELLHSLDDLSAQVRQDVVQAELNLLSATSRLEVAKDQARTAEEDYHIATRRYDAQVGTNIDVLDAAMALSDSRTAYVNAVYDIAMAQSRLIFAIGDDMPPKSLLLGGEIYNTISSISSDDLEVLR